MKLLFNMTGACAPPLLRASLGWPRGIAHPISSRSVHFRHIPRGGPGAALKVRLPASPGASCVAEIGHRQSATGNREGFRLAESPAEPDKILEGLAAGATVNVNMRAVNETGPGSFGEPVQAAVA